jgi:hypothetical protein
VFFDVINPKKIGIGFGRFEQVVGTDAFERRWDRRETEMFLRDRRASEEPW